MPKRMKRWPAFIQDATGVASSLLVVGAVTENFAVLPVTFTSLVAGSLFAIFTIVFLWKIALDVVRGEPRKTFIFRRPAAHRRIDDAPIIGSVIRFFGRDAASARARTERRVRRWMLRELKDSSNATIVTRDLSWARPTDKPLVDLAEAGKLRIISCTLSHTPSEQESLTKFTELGARVDHWRVEAPARFSIFEKHGQRRIAIALPEKHRHIIVVVNDGEDGLYRLANGFVNAVDAPKVRGLASV